LSSAHVALLSGVGVIGRRRRLKRYKRNIYFVKLKQN